MVLSFAGLSSAGLYQINLTLLLGLGTGDVPLVADLRPNPASDLRVSARLPNREDDPGYIVYLIGQVIRVSVETQDIVRALPAFRS